jgi:hypothetical protein
MQAFLTTHLATPKKGFALRPDRVFDILVAQRNEVNNDPCCFFPPRAGENNVITRVGKALVD